MARLHARAKDLYIYTKLAQDKHAIVGGGHAHDRPEQPTPNAHRTVLRAKLRNVTRNKITQKQASLTHIQQE